MKNLINYHKIIYMKTPMQELIEKIKDAIPYLQMNIYEENFNNALKNEKAHIINAYNTGRFNEIDKKQVSSEQFYNKTYQNK